ncbi:hypothetical protein X798_05347 [Onchocerca flexuosa]|uniref:Uncharacterized protein n=1 Tax=Onchocerca flexuosa TaxID=387005 RepID=A0A238BSH1_9BILA|nr:hypothetical protein X798_05347 [Onchocerca flexuosa]
MRLLLIACATFIITISLPIASAQETDSSTEPTDINTIDSAESSSQVCRSNEIFDGKMCKCAPGYFMQSDKESRLRCEDECEEVYSSFFTYGACVGDIFGRLPKNAQPQCNMRCGVRIHTLTSVGIFLTFAAALATLIFTLPVCVTTCISCLSARKASKTAKRVFIETQNQPYKDQQFQTLPYNPYAYWPYYGRA